MKKFNLLPRFFTIFSIVCGLFASCGGSQKPASVEPQVATPAPIARLTIGKDSVIRVRLSSGSSQSYDIYIPSQAKSPETTPILICFDPHGAGRIPIDKYKKWADKFNIAIAGSNSSRNGLDATQGQVIANAMISDIHDRLGFDKRNMALCGFSGGAKVAINAIGANSDITKLIYAGAVTQLNAAHSLNILGFAGDQDMNYSDLLQFDESIKSTNPASALIEFSGKHEWPDAAVFSKAFYWLAIRSANTDSSYVKKNIDDFITTTKRINSKSESLSATYQECSFAVFLLDGIRDVSDYRDVMKKTEPLAEYQKSVANRKESITYETNQKQILMQAFQSQNTDWWAKVINNYKTSPKLSDKRLLGFISLGCYSYSNQLLAQHNTDGAEKILAIYEMADPTNTDQLYFHAMLNAMQNKNPEAIKYLQKAVANGFSDLNKTESEPAFISLRNTSSYSLIVASLKKTSR